MPSAFALRRLSLLVAVAACSSTPRSVITIEPPPPPQTRAVLAGPLCKADGCTCRDENAAGDGGAGAPDATHKRFEVRVGPTDNDLWVTVDSHVLYKTKERATECFYLDLPSGNHKITLRASRPQGVQAGLAISELGVAAASWYRTFRFSCGVQGTCSHDELDGVKADMKQFKAGLHDPCGSVRIKGLNWDTGVAPDQIHPQDLAVALTLDVYKFLPGKPSGDPTCGTGSSAAPPAGDPPADESPTPP
jgi:hypothetical protein